MNKKIAVTFALLMPFVASVRAQDAKTVAQNALKSLGSEDMKVLQFTASGYGGAQLKDGNTPGPRSIIQSYIYTVDYSIPAARTEARNIGGLPPQTMLGGLGRSLTFVNGEYAWDVGGVPGIIGDAQRPADWPIIAFPPTFKKAGDPLRQPDGDGLQSHSDVDRNEQMWLTPQGFLIGATKNPSTVKQEMIDGKKFQVITWNGPNGQKIIGYIDEKNEVEKVETWMDHPMYGDEHVVRVFDYYRDFAGIQFPAHIVETVTTPALTGAKSQGPELFVYDVKQNVPVDLSVPQSVKDTPVPPPATIMTTKMTQGDGLYWIAGQNDCSLVVEFKDFITVVEGPMNDDRSVAVIAEIRKLIPNKPIRYLINTHPHVDHTGGVRGYAAIGATIITHQDNVEFIKELLQTPHTIIPDSLSKNPGAKYHVEGVAESRVITDGTRKLELYHVQGNLHSSAMLMTYLPKEKILTEGDPWTPGMVNPKPKDRAYQRCCDAQNLYENIERLHLDVKTFAPIHGRIDTWDNFLVYLGLPPENASAKLQNGQH